MAETGGNQVVASNEEEAVEQTKPLCHKCYQAMETHDIAAKKFAGDKPTCRSCHNLLSMLGKQMSLKELQKELPEDHMTNFCRQVHTARSSADGVLKYSQVRDLLQTTLSNKVVQTFRQGSGGTYQPLSWWQQNGYDVKKVEEKGFKRECPVFGDVYRVDLYSVNQEWANEQSEARIISCEQAIRRKRTASEIEAAKPKARTGKKGRGKGKAAAAVDAAESAATPAVEPSAEDLALEAVLVDLEDMEAEDDDCVIVDARGTSSADRANRAALRKQERDDARQAKKDTKVISAMAGKGLPALRPLREKVLKLVEQLKPFEDQLPGITMNVVTSAEKNVNQYHTELVGVMKKISNGGTVSMNEISFDNEKDMFSKFKALGESLKAMNAAKKSVQPKK